MSLRDTVLGAVAVVDKTTKSLQPFVTYSRAVIDTTGFSAVSYPTSVQLQAIVEWKKMQLRTPTGIISVTRPNIMFLDIAALVAATNGEGISDHDKIVLPDGTTGPILNLSGFMDAGTGKPFATECFLG